MGFLYSISWKQEINVLLLAMLELVLKLFVRVKINMIDQFSFSEKQMLSRIKHLYIYYENDCEGERVKE